MIDPADISLAQEQGKTEIKRKVNNYKRTQRMQTAAMVNSPVIYDYANLQ